MTTAGMSAYYFGCWQQVGHAFFAPGMLTVSPRDVAIPWDSYGIDGKLCPPGRGRGAANQQEGVAALHHKDGWTALAFWDRTVDTRGGSNSAFLLEGEHDYTAALALARETFPEVFARLRFEIVEAR